MNCEKKFHLALDQWASLRSELGTAASYRRWVQSALEGPVRISESLKPYVFGQIFWKKSLGRPLSLNLSDAFEVTALVSEDVGRDSETKQAETWIRITVEASMWDSQSDPDYWRISFMFSAPEGDVVHITPRLRSPMRWQWDAIGSRSFSPPGFEFVKQDRFAYVSFELSSEFRFVMDSHGVVVRP